MSDEKPSARDRLRAFEDAHLGPDAVRINGEVEKGHGSAFKLLSPAHHNEYAALERLIVAETRLGAAESALSAAQSDHATATAAVEAAAVPAPETAAEAARED